MSLKLFRATEFAQSRNFSPQRQRSAIHPAWIVVLTSAWLALAGNWVLWRALAQVPEIGPGATWWITVRLALLLAAGNCALLGLFMWRRTLKPAATALMLVTAWSGNPWDRLTSAASWLPFLTMAVIAILPAAWLLRTEVRRLPLWRNLVQVGMIEASCCVVFALTLLFVFKDLRVLSANHPELWQMVSPYGAAHATDP